VVLWNQASISKVHRAVKTFQNFFKNLGFCSPGLQPGKASLAAAVSRQVLMCWLTRLECSTECMQVLHADCAASSVSLCDSSMNHLYLINL